MRKLLFTFLLTLAMINIVDAQEFITGSDDASNYSQSDYVAQGNLGFGFGNWYTNANNGGWFRGAAADQGVNSAPVDVSGNSFGIWGQDFCNLGRLLSASLPDGGSLSFQLAYQYDNGNRGFTLNNGAWDTEVFNFNINSSGYSWTGGNTSPSTPWTGQREFGVSIQFTFTRQGADVSYAFSSVAGGAPSGSGLLIGASFDRVKFYVAGGGTGGTGVNMYVNRFKESYTVPSNVPSTANVVVSGAAVVSNTQTLSANDLSISSGSGLTLQSGASLIVNGTITGNVTVEKSLQDANFHLLFPPVNATIAAVPTFNGYYLDKYVEANGEWTRLTDADNVTPDQGYSLKYSSGSGTLSFTGTLFNDDLTFTNLSYTPTAAGYGYGWNLVGNPFPSAVDLDLGGFTNSGLNGFVYVWTGANYVSGSLAGAAGTLTGNIVPANQGFFVKTEAESNSLTIPKAARVHNGTAFYKEVEQVENVIGLTVAGNNATDKMLFSIHPEASQGYDSRFDAFKLFGNTDAPQLYSLVDDEKMSVNSVNTISNETEWGVMLQVGVSGEYTLTAEHLETFLNGTEIMLEDLKSGARQNLSQMPVYQFTASPADDPARFKLSFAGVGIEDNPLQRIGVFAVAGQLVVQLPVDIDAEVQVCNTTGQVVANQALHGSGTTTLNTRLNTGIYLVTFTSANTTITRKVLVK